MAVSSSHNRKPLQNTLQEGGISSQAHTCLVCAQSFCSRSGGVWGGSLVQQSLVPVSYARSQGYKGYNVPRPTREGKPLQHAGLDRDKKQVHSRPQEEGKGNYGHTSETLQIWFQITDHGNKASHTNFCFSSEYKNYIYTLL